MDSFTALVTVVAELGKVLPVLSVILERYKKKCAEKKCATKKNKKSHWDGFYDPYSQSERRRKFSYPACFQLPSHHLNHVVWMLLLRVSHLTGLKFNHVCDLLDSKYLLSNWIMHFNSISASISPNGTSTSLLEWPTCFQPHSRQLNHASWVSILNVTILAWLDRSYFAILLALDSSFCF